eukprot:5729341-Amphidinium_carterae.1
MSIGAVIRQTFHIVVGRRQPVASCKSGTAHHAQGATHQQSELESNQVQPVSNLPLALSHVR